MPTPSASEPLTLDPALIARFRDDLAGLIDPARDRVLVALSGGADSIALLLLARAALGERCTAATVDHGLRPAARDEASTAAALCARLEVSHAILTAPLPPRARRTANVSARARTLRYALLKGEADRVGADWIATAHHADDQLETAVMRLNRGAGVAGLAGIRRTGWRVIRPLLGWRRGELAAIVARAGIAAVVDPSNTDPRYDRARLRAALQSADWLDPARFDASASALADADEALAWTTQRLLTERVIEAGDTVLLDWAGLPAELLRRTVGACLARIDPSTIPDGPALGRLIAALLADRAVTLGGVWARPGPKWTFSPAPPRRTS